MSDTHLMDTYSRLAIQFTHGEGVWLWDNKGTQYLDAICGIAVTGLGHAHPDVTRTICEQAGKLLHTSNLFQIERQVALGEKLTAIASMDNAFFCNSGAEANEAAIKIARLYGHKKNIAQPSIIVTENSFHGRTLATLSATGSRKVQAGFEPLVGGFARAPYNDIEAIHNIGKSNKNVVAVMVEPIQGESGINIPDENYLIEIRKLCDKYGWLMILDEIQTGMGRTGQWFGYQHFPIKPDVLTVAKSLGNGVPIGACLASGNAAKVFQPGNHGSTFGGNPLACAASLSVIDVIERDNLKQRATHLGNNIVSGLKQNLAGLNTVKDIRGKGLLIAIELTAPCKSLVQAALEEKLLINVAGDNRIRLLPPLILNDEQAQQLVERVSSVVKTFRPQ